MEFNFNWQLVDLAENFEIQLSELETLILFDLRDLEDFQKKFCGCTREHLKYQDLTRDLIIKNWNQTQQKELESDSTKINDTLRRLYCMSYYGCIYAGDEDENREKDALLALDMVDKLQDHLKKLCQKDSSDPDEIVKNMRAMMKMCCDYTIKNFKENCLVRVLRIALDISMYESRRSFWTEYKLMSLDSCHNSDVFRTNSETPLLREVLDKHNEDNFEDILTKNKKHIQDSICEFIMSREYYKDEAEQINKKLEKIIHEKLKVETSTEPKCFLCLDRMQNIIFKPCGHVCVCHECYEKLEKKNTCPFCNKHVDRIVNLLDFYKANSTNIDWTQKLSIFPTAMMLQSFPKLQKTTRNPYSIHMHDQNMDPKWSS